MFDFVYYAVLIVRAVAMEDRAEMMMMKKKKSAGEEKSVALLSISHGSTDNGDC
jgi:hypothetical protein